MKRWWQESALPCRVAKLVAHLSRVSLSVNRIETKHAEKHRRSLPASTVRCSAAGKPRIYRNGALLLHSYWSSAARSAYAVAGTSMVAALYIQHRLCASQADPTPATKIETMTEKEFGHYFFDCSLPHRLAALTVAKFQLMSLQRRAASTEDAVRYMPMFDFVRGVPPLVRNDMFRRQQDAVRWVEASPLLQLVDQNGNLISPNVTPSFVENPDRSEGNGNSPSYNPLLHVGVLVAPEWVQRAAAADPSATETTTPSPASTKNDNNINSSDSSGASTFSRGLQGEVAKAAVQEALVHALRFFEDAAMRKAAVLLGQQEDRAAAAVAPTDNDDDCDHTAPPNSLSISRYVPLVDVLKHIHRDATAARDDALTSTLPTATQEVLQTLSMTMLEQVVDICGVLVPVGIRHRRDEYPALQTKCLWVVRASKLPHQPRATVFVALRRVQDTEPPRFRFAHPRVTVATPSNNYGGWGSAINVPTKADVYEILKYIPVNWGNIGLLNIPADVKKRHIRCSSSQQWFRRQPYYFEMRNFCGTTEIRRSIVLHPEAHGLTKEEACELLELQLATGEANNLIYLDNDGVPADGEQTLLERTAIKFLLRVCPTYFAPMSLIAQRYTRKNLSEVTMLATARKRPQDFEELTTRFSDVVLLRRRGGVDSSRWRSAFVADLEKYPEDVRGIMMLCNRMCPSWDRPEFIYVRLSEGEQQAIGGYEGMVRILQRHPTIFRVGKHFVCRADPSDPLTLQDAEPAHDDVTARSVLREENPYQSPMDVALVFHYVAPDNEPCTAAYLADCASPAIRCVLPTRITTIVQQFPKLFACTETSPGVFAIRKLKQRVLKPTARISGAIMHHNGDNNQGKDSNKGTTTAEASTDDDGDLIQMLEDEIAEDEHMTKEEVIQAVRALVPDSGVESSQLLLWASMNVQRAANEYFGGVLKLAEALPQHFRVVTTEQTKTVYRV